jgi:hypothetical protein
MPRDDPHPLTGLVQGEHEDLVVRVLTDHELDRTAPQRLTLSPDRSTDPANPHFADFTRV